MRMSREIQETYHIEGEIGRGGVGTIYKAYHKRLRKYVVLKKINRPQDMDKRDFRREVDILKDLHHEYLPQVYDFLELDGNVFTVMDFIAGYSVKEYLDAGYTFGKEDIIRYGTQLCEALSYLHNRVPPIIHGDIKPANIMITEEGKICLIDFNISGITGPDRTAYLAGLTTAYAAPEQLAQLDWYRARQRQVERGEIPSFYFRGIAANTRTDVYSLAATLFHMFTGRTPEHMDAGAYLTSLEEGFCYILNKALCANPKDRYSDAEHMLHDFYNVDKLSGGYRRKKRIRKVLVAVLALTFVIGGVGVWATIGHIKKARQEAYLECIDRMDRLGGKDQEEFEKEFYKAVEINDSSPDAYYEKARFLYKQQNYTEALSVIEKEILDKRRPGSRDLLGRVYGLAGRCCMDNSTDRENRGAKDFKRSEYLDAVAYYKRAIDADRKNGTYYSECAIAYARADRGDDALEMVEEAKKKGVGSDVLDLVNAQILASEGRQEEALDAYVSCIEKTKDSEVKCEAYVGYADLLKGEVSPESYERQISWLEKAEGDLPPECLGIIYNRLANVCQNYYDYTAKNEEAGDEEQAYRAIEAWQKVIDEGSTISWTPYRNQVIIFQQLGEYDKADTVLDSVKDKYREDYRWYARKGELVFARMNELPEAERDYREFEESYRRAKELYQSFSGQEDAVGSMDMNNLEYEHKQLVDSGLINE